MQLSSQTVLRIITLVLAVVVVGLGVLVIFTFVEGLTDKTPHTEIERAVIAAEESVRANPEDPAARQKLAAAYLDQGYAGAAREQADIAIRIDPADPTGYYILGLVQRESGDAEDAIASLDRAVNTPGQLAQFYQDAYYALALTYEETGDDTKALESFDAAIDNNPDNAVMLFERARFYERLEQWADAIYDYAITLTYDPAFPSAEDSYLRLVEQHPEDAEQAEEWLSIWGDSSTGMTE